MPNQHPSVVGQSNVIYEEASGEMKEDLRIYAWEKTQELRSGECTLWDHCFELPGNHLEAREKTSGSVTVGKVTHNLNVGGNDQLEIYDYPGGCAQRFDGVDRNGEPRPADIKQIFPDSKRIVRVRMEQEEVDSLQIQGASDCGHFVPGHKFNLERHFDADDSYLLTRVEHDARVDNYQVNRQKLEFHYGNRFTCIPAVVPYRPTRVTPKPEIAGIQTATVVGPAGEEIFCDKYGRVKVQFHWDREGKKDVNSSCWLRVAQVWAGNGWGAFFWPRIDHEVVVIFEEGDPDQPLIVGSVYNAQNMPWFTLPANKRLGGFKSASVRGRASENYNGIVFDDTKGREHLGIHSERHMSFNTEYDKVFHSGRHKGESVTAASVFTVGGIPGGGGSGGGFDDGDQTPMTHPGPAEVPGLNSVWTYGENLQVAVGLNHQLALGNNLQICVNPLGLVAGVPGIPAAPFLTGALGSGQGGNMQFTIGSSAQFVLGQSYDINIGPPRITVTAGPGKDGGEDGNYGTHIATDILCGVIGATIIIWALAYGLDVDNQHRANESFIFQLILDALLAAVLLVEMNLQSGDKKLDDNMKALYRLTTESKNYDSNDALSSFGVMCTMGAAAILPISRTIEEEGP